ncbi:MAG: ABC transporter ATP-binding protein [Chthonomonadales bacterium]
MAAATGEALIEFTNVDLGYGSRKVLTNINLRVGFGDFLGIVGPNGAGKTTMLKAILGLLKPLAGDVRTTSEGLRIGYVPQRDSVDSLFPLTVMDIVLMGRYRGLSAIGRPTRADKDAAAQAIGHVGITDLANRPYPNLSGGQKQRALIARALVGKPNLLILDEPTNGMDLASERAIMELVRHLHDSDGITVLMVSHLLNTVVNYSQRIAIVGDGIIREGEITEMITSEALSSLYSLPIQVLEIDGRRVILPPGTLEQDAIKHAAGGVK